MSTVKSLRILLRRTMAIALLAIPMEAASEDRRIALAFDDAPGSSNNEALLDELKRLDIKAAIFPESKTLKNNAPKRTKSKARQRQQIVTAIAHREIDGAKQILRDLDKRNLTALSPSFAPSERGLFGASDWDFHGDPLAEREDPREIAELLAENAFPGAVVILRPLHNQREHILQALPTISKRLKAEGYEFATLSELLEPKRSSNFTS